MIAALFIAAWDLFAPPEHMQKMGQGPP
jgi:hypothetical protein